MRNLVPLAVREIRSLFLAPSSYLVLALFLFLTGYFFRLVLVWADGDISLAYRTFASSVYFRVFLGVLPPLLTMRTIAAERAGGTLELLLTAPVRDGEVVLSKYLGAAAFYAALWLPTLLYPVALYRFGGSPDFGQVASFTLGVLCIGALLLAGGLLCSALLQSVSAAFSCAFVLDVLILFGMGGLLWLAPSPSVRQWIGALNVTAHLDDFARGIVDVRSLVFYGTGTALFLFLATRTLESRRWR